MSPPVKMKVRSVNKQWPERRGGDRKAGEEIAVLKEIDLDIHEGEFLCLLGPSGCGKTTLLNILAGFERPSSGSVLIDDAASDGPHPKRITIWQDYALFPWRTVLGNVEFGLEMTATPKAERRRKAKELLELVGLTGEEKKMTWELSGGMRQRVAVARSLAVDPDVLFMDEPFGALDALTRIKMEEELIRIWQRKRTTIVFVTHDIDEAVYLADRIAVFTALPGRILQIIPAPAGRPRDRTTLDFIRLREKVFTALSLGHAEAVEYYL